MIGLLIGSALAGLAGTALNWGINAAEADKARAFEAEQAQINREFNAAEADKARQFSAQQRATAYQDTVKDMESAGLNPYAMYGSFSGASGSYSSQAASSPGIASGNAASVGGNALSGLQDMMRTSFMLNALKKQPGGEAALKQVIQAVSYGAKGQRLGSKVTKTFGY